MKKILLTILLVISVFTFSGCNEADEISDEKDTAHEASTIDENDNILGNEEQSEPVTIPTPIPIDKLYLEFLESYYLKPIKLDYLNNVLKHTNSNATIDDVNLIHFYWGIAIKNAVDISYVKAAVMFSDSFLEVLGSEIVGGVEIKYNNSNRIVIWSSGNFYSLKEAYSKGLISITDIIEINDQQKKFYPFLYGLEEPNQEVIPLPVYIILADPWKKEDFQYRFNFIENDNGFTKLKQTFTYAHIAIANYDKIYHSLRSFYFPFNDVMLDRDLNKKYLEEKDNFFTNNYLVYCSLTIKERKEDLKVYLEVDENRKTRLVFEGYNNETELTYDGKTMNFFLVVPKVDLDSIEIIVK